MNGDATKKPRMYIRGSATVYNRTMGKKTQPVPKNFEDGMRELETILSDIERGEMGVEESLVRYERGAFLIQHCRGVLNKAQLQIETLAKAPPAAGTDEVETDPVEEV
jgi:exodeoxyribonuclease VII small subunit